MFRVNSPKDYHTYNTFTIRKENAASWLPTIRVMAHQNDFVTPTGACNATQDSAEIPGIDTMLKNANYRPCLRRGYPTIPYSEAHSHRGKRGEDLPPPQVQHTLTFSFIICLRHRQSPTTIRKGRQQCVKHVPHWSTRGTPWERNCWVPCQGTVVVFWSFSTLRFSTSLIWSV